MYLVKRVVFFTVCLVLLSGVVGNFTASAGELKQEEPVVELLWENTASISLHMSFSNGTITSTGRVNGQNGTTAISATFVLARRNANGTFTEVDRWSATNGVLPMQLSTSRTTRNQPTGTYRLSVTAQVTRNGKTETVFGNHTATF